MINASVPPIPTTKVEKLPKDYLVKNPPEYFDPSCAYCHEEVYGDANNLHPRCHVHSMRTYKMTGDSYSRNAYSPQAVIRAEITKKTPYKECECKIPHKFDNAFNTNDIKLCAKCAGIIPVERL